MNISSITHSQLMMGVELKYDENSAHRCRRVWGKDIDKKHQGIVYFITVNDEIVKIGGSSSTIGKLVAQYLINLESKAEPRENRFCLHLRILSHLIKGDVVKYYYIPVQDMVTHLEGMFGEMLTAHHREFRIVESRLIEQYKIMNDSVPAWNNTEGKIGWSEEIIAIFDKREMAMKNGDDDFFSYDEYVNDYRVGLA
jgi:hypothetical protein